MKTEIIKVSGSQRFTITVEYGKDDVRVQLEFSWFRDHVWSQCPFVMRTTLIKDFVDRIKELTYLDRDIICHEVRSCLEIMEQQHD